MQGAAAFPGLGALSGGEVAKSLLPVTVTADIGSKWSCGVRRDVIFKMSQFVRSFSPVVVDIYIYFNLRPGNR